MDEKREESICRQTWDLISKIGSVPSQYEGKFQCAADGSPSKDPLLEDLQSPPRAITSDSDLRACIYERYVHFGGRRYEHELPDMLPRSDRAVFTHGDIAPRNIMADENNNITSIIDWEYAGWYLDYWEYALILRPAFWGDWSIWMERTAQKMGFDWYQCVSQGSILDGIVVLFGLVATFEPPTPDLLCCAYRGACVRLIILDLPCGATTRYMTIS
ncbi:hypothetical protein AARAC_008927 [Aspergillus arachidicola]|uniref:Aminoglycoside phosphotransferase domain-containing protein n=1 Tax=Aspergillus arachidicola TaxID=656916 RepID=A0A2G7G9Z5_9EURO|nr:hypothetical protein AARAC_008927 [Aspergillus arachidicola]